MHSQYHVNHGVKSTYPYAPLSTKPQSDTPNSFLDGPVPFMPIGAASSPNLHVPIPVPFPGTHLSVPSHGPQASLRITPPGTHFRQRGSSFSQPRPSQPPPSPSHAVRGRSNSISHSYPPNIAVQTQRGNDHPRKHTPSPAPVRERHGHHSKTKREEHRPAKRPFYPQQIPNPQFRYSTCSGNRKALCIGINYQGQKHQLLGCINDAKNVYKFLTRHCNYAAGDIVLLTDDATHSRSLPTKQNILDAMKWLVKDARTNDALFLHYSGHGGQIRDKEGDEKDGYDEIIFPLDFKKNGYIVDDRLNDILAKPLPAGCRLTAIFDSCHSGTLLDLPYIYSSRGHLKDINIWNNLVHNHSPADIISFSACQDWQTSADVSYRGNAGGAMSYAFMKVMKENPNVTYMQLLQSLRHILGNKYQQQTQLCSSHPIDTNLKFIM